VALIGWMRRSKFDRIYDLEASARTNFYFQALKPFPPEWSGSAPGCALPHRDPNRTRMHVLERQAGQLEAAGIWPNAPTSPGDAPPPDLSWILKLAPEQRPVPGAGKPRPYVLMAPGGTTKTDRIWPIENYAALAGRLASQGFDIVVVGGPEESALARTIQRAAKNARDLTGRTDFAQIAVLGARAALAVGNDSGATHLMAAAGAPTIALFSNASDPELTGPRGYVAILKAQGLKDLPMQQVAETAQVMTRSA
jgi:ADP-heptose:LPS heptosyltransferase